MLQSRRFQCRYIAIRPRVPAVSLSPSDSGLSTTSLRTPSPRRSRWGAIVLAIYAIIAIAAFASGRAWLDELAAFILSSLLLWPGLRRRSIAAWTFWLIAACGILVLAWHGRGELALDFMPVMVNAALCILFARTLAPGRQPLIARLIAAIEGAERLALPRVADYARQLTRAWALLLGLQASVLTLLIACTVPDGLFASFGVSPPFEISGGAWRWYLHLGSYALVLAFLGLEYAYRRWHLRHVPHPSLPAFIARLAKRWPALVRSIADDEAGARP
jgi:uncharacterized membrane protein